MKTTNTGEPLKYLVHGIGHTIEELQKFSVVTPKTTPSDISYHKGFRVVGHPPGLLEQAKTLSEASSVNWDECQWSNSRKKKFVRSEPYAIISSAETCAELARKAGWSYVCIVAVCKGEAC